MIDMGRGKPTETGEKRPFRIQWTLVAIALGLMTAAGGAVLLVSPFFEATKKYQNDWLALGLLIGGLFLANMARMLTLWGRIHAALRIPRRRRDIDAHIITRRGFRELFAYVFISFATLTGLVFLSTFPETLPWSELSFVDPKAPSAIFVLFGCIGLTLLVPLVAFYLIARAEEQFNGRKFLRHDAVAVETFWIGLIIVGGIVALAQWAAATSSDISENLSFAITFLVICLFIGFIFVPHINRFFIRQAEARDRHGATITGQFLPLAAPAIFASWIDSILVRLIAPISGATQSGPGIPHLFVVLTLLPLTALGFVLAPPYGLAPIGLGMLIAMALGRRWAWIEEDRETASRLLKTDGDDIHVGFDNDLKDEALLGYASLFLLVPLALNQIYGLQSLPDSQVRAFEPGIGHTGNAFFDWISFFGAELAKAVPFVDWWEIYNVSIPETFKPVEGNPLGKHLTFAARAMVDLVIMAALFQAIAIWQRARAQRKLYTIGHVNHFEPFAERAFFESAFANGESEPREEFVKQISLHIDAREQLRLPGQPYNTDRLADLLNSDSAEVRRTALWMVQKFQLLTGTPPEQIRQLRQHWLNLSFPQMSGSRVPSQRKRLLEEKRKFEQLILELIEDISVVKLEETGILLGLIEDVRQIPEMSFAQIEALRLFGMLRNEYAMLALAAHVLPSSEIEWRQRVQAKFGKPTNLYLEQAPMRMKVYEALEVFGTNPPATPGILNTTLEFLDDMSQRDRDNKAKERARKAAEKIREAGG